MSKIPQYSPFTFLNAINYSKEKLLDTDDVSIEKKYEPFIVNMGLSYFIDTVMYANEMNRWYHASKHMQFSYLLNTIRRQKRFKKWLKPPEIDNLKAVKSYYGYSNHRAKEALSLLSKEQIDYIKERLYKGGRK